MRLPLTPPGRRRHIVFTTFDLGIIGQVLLLFLLLSAGIESKSSATYNPMANGEAERGLRGEELQARIVEVQSSR